MQAGLAAAGCVLRRNFHSGVNYFDMPPPPSPLPGVFCGEMLWNLCIALFCYLQEAHNKENDYKLAEINELQAEYCAARPTRQINTPLANGDPSYADRCPLFNCSGLGAVVWRNILFRWSELRDFA